MRHALFIAVIAVLAANCGTSSPAAPAGSTTTPASLAISGATTIDLIGLTSSLIAVLNHGDSTSSVVTSQAIWQSSNPSAVTVTANGVATAVGVGTSFIMASYQGNSATLSVRVGAPLNCVTYDPASLKVLSEPEGYDVVAPVAGSSLYDFLSTFDTPADGADGLAVYQRYNNVCYVGRDNTRANRLAYVFVYWLNKTGSSTTIAKDDCEPYDRSTVQVVSVGSAGWAVNASGRQLMLLDTAADATTMAEMAKTYSNQCYVGRGNTRSNPSMYIMPYWK